MKTLSLYARRMSLYTIALVGLASYTQPDGAWANLARFSLPIAQTDDTRIAQTKSVDDAADRVEDALENHATLKSFDLDADDEGNAIAIEGTVKDETQRTLAEEVAKQTAPGFTIINRIKIESEGKP